MLPSMLPTTTNDGNKSKLRQHFKEQFVAVVAVKSSTATGCGNRPEAIQIKVFEENVAVVALILEKRFVSVFYL